MEYKDESYYEEKADYEEGLWNADRCIELEESYYEEKADYEEGLWNADRCIELEEIECKDCEITFSADEQAQMFGGD